MAQRSERIKEDRRTSVESRFTFEDTGKIEQSGNRLGAVAAEIHPDG